MRFAVALVLTLVAPLRIAAMEAQAITLRAPLTTVVDAAPPMADKPVRINATLQVPSDAPADLGIGAWLADHDGNWFQTLQPNRLTPGRHSVSFDLSALAPVQAEGHAAAWDPAQAATSTRAGIFLWSASNSTATITLDTLTVHGEQAAVESAAANSKIINLKLDQFDAERGQSVGTTGKRWQAQFTLPHMPENPYDPQRIRIDGIITHETRGETWVVPGFYSQPVHISDRGDKDPALAKEAGFFAIRFRPPESGQYRIRLDIREHAGLAGYPNSDLEIPAPNISTELPPLQVNGEAWDDYVRVDREDPRFFTINNTFYWPVGLNIRSVWDVRGRERTGSVLTPPRILPAYEAYLRRLAASGATAAEIWCSSWNLALEWRGDWPEYEGLGRYNQGNAARLDAILDLAYELGLRINLVVRNHGQASERTDREWENSAFNIANGGVIKRAAEFFTDPVAKQYQYNLRRYMIGRYADHPAILGWKLWTEVNLTSGRRDQVRAWHAETSVSWAALDSYDHPISTHWSGDYRQPDRGIVRLPGITYVCIDAYHGGRDRGRGKLLAQLMWDSTLNPVADRGLAQFGKPVLVTEYGGNWNAAPQPQLLAEHQSGPWAALMAGHAGSPMLWWFEWVDQQNLWNPYRSIAAFLKGEDMRDPKGRSIQLATPGMDGWCAAWVRKGNLLGYVMDRSWGYDGRRTTPITSGQVAIDSAIQAGPMLIEWWDANGGTLISRETIQHPGGALSLSIPSFARHIAFKLRRLQLTP